MTTITKADIPADITTLEQLAVWCAVGLASLNAQTTVIEGPGIFERAAQANPYYISADNKSRLLVRLSLELSPDYLVGGQKFWKYALPLSDNPIPQTMKA